MIRIGNQNQNGSVVPTINGGTSRESSAEKQVVEKVEEVTSSVVETIPTPEPLSGDAEAEAVHLPEESSHPEGEEEEEPMSTSEPPATQPPPPEEELLVDVQPDRVKDDDEEEEVED